MGTIVSILIVGLFLVGGAALAIMLVAKKLVYIAGPNEVLVFSGGKNESDRAGPSAIEPSKADGVFVSL